MEVFKELPEDGIETNFSGWPKPQYRKMNLEELYDQNRYYYYCPNCQGFIKGTMAQKRIDTLRPLAGRRGTEYSCRKCRSNLGFEGMVS